MTEIIEQQAQLALKRNGKTFWFASLFLPRQMANDAAVLYSFCRNLDDIADETTTSDRADDSVERLQLLRKDLRARNSQDPLLAEIIQLASRTDLNLHAAICLLDTLLEDARSGAEIADEIALIRYCYGAAGTVGLMMCAILGVTSSSAKLQAIDLGIAMQLTNIARDVVEDAQIGRRYVPLTWVNGLDAEQISGSHHEDAVRHSLAAGVRRVLDLADAFYAAATPGFDEIPPQARRSIRVAAAVYRQIGVKLRQRGCMSSDRVVVPFLSKVQIAATIYLGKSELEKLPPPDDSTQLHKALSGLPGLP